MIKVDNLTKDFVLGFKKIRILNNINFEIFTNEVFGIIGPNGAGKTTIMKIILGILSPTKGEVRINGKSPKNLSVKRNTGYLPEEPYFYQYLTAKEFLTFIGQLFKIRSRLLQEKINILLEKVGLKEVKNLPLRQFSKGMLQRIGIAASLVNNPSQILLDEPMSGLDPLGRIMVKNIIYSLKKEGKTILLNSHILEDIEKLCDRIAILDKGKIVSIAKIDVVQKKGGLEQYFLNKIPKNN